MNSGGRHVAELARIPAQQRFDRHNLPRTQINFGLVDELQFASLGRVAKRRFECELAHHALAALRAEERDSVVPVACANARCSRSLQQSWRVLTVGREHRDSDDAMRRHFRPSD
jgi:hypothetical protein